MTTSSTLLAEEHFASSDSRFLSALYDVAVPRETVTRPGWGGRPVTLPAPYAAPPKKAHPFSAFAAKWLADPRPWAREQLLAYIADGCDRPGHRTLVKRLYKGAEARRDDELVVRFALAFDRLRRTRVRKRYSYDFVTRESRVLEVVESARPRGNGALHFSQRTRSYLQRRAAHYLLAIAREDAARHRRLVLSLLALYEDRDFARGEDVPRRGAFVRLLVPQGLGRRRLDYVVTTPLAELAPAPSRASLWKDAGLELVTALEACRSLFVRRLLVRWIERDHGAVALDVGTVRRLLTSSHPDVQAFGARRLEGAVGLDRLTVDEWLALLRVEHPDALRSLAERMRQLVTPARLTLAQCVAIARHDAYAPAVLGAAWLAEKSVTTREQLDVALGVLDATVDAARARALIWLTPLLASEGLSVDAHVRELLDSRHADVRAHAFELLRTTARFRDSIVLWAALAESPHADARAFLLDHLAKRRAALEDSLLSEDSLQHVWATTLLDVSRGSRAKQRALTQLGERVASQPQQADLLLPLLVIALRSVRETERRGAVTALVRAALRVPELHAALAHHVPDLAIEPPSATPRRVDLEGSA